MAITPNKPWYIHTAKDEKLFGPPYTIKAKPNNLINNDFKYENVTALWRDKIAFRCCPKLTSKHISVKW